MLYTALKVLITAVLVVAISEAGKRSSAFGALLASLPLTSLLAFVWIYGETGDTAKIAAAVAEHFLVRAAVAGVVYRAAGFAVEWHWILAEPSPSHRR